MSLQDYVTRMNDMIDKYGWQTCFKCKKEWFKLTNFQARDPQDKKLKDVCIDCMHIILEERKKLQSELNSSKQEKTGFREIKGSTDIGKELELSGL